MKKNLFLISALFLSACNGTSTPSSSIETAESTNPIDPNIFVNETVDYTISNDNYRNYYEIFVSSYADSNGDGIGDLNGITAKLPYLHDLGYTGIWLTPIFASTTYHKYNASNYFEIDPTFGTMDDLKTLVAKAHELNIKIILDGVFNHSSDVNAWFDKSVLAHKKELAGQTLTDEEKNFADLYRFYDSKSEAEASGTRFKKAGANDFYYECNFTDDMPEFNFDSEYTYTLIESIIDYYMGPDIDVDGFRLDAVKYYKLNNTEENVKILSRIAKMIKDNDPNGYAVGECWDGATTIGNYYKSDLDSYFWFPATYETGLFRVSVSDYNGSNKSSYYRGMTNMEKYSTKIPAAFLDNHDMQRLSLSNDPLGVTQFRLGLLGTMKGSVFHYYGDEIGMVSTEGTGDANYRTHYYWDDETHEMETEDAPGASKQPQLRPGAKQQLEDPNSILNYTKKVNQMRLSYPFIARGTTVTPDEEDAQINKSISTGLMVVKKQYENKNYKILINFSAYHEATYQTNGYTPKYVITIKDDQYATYVDSSLTLPAYSIAILAE